MNIEVNIKDYEFTLTIDDKIELKGNAILFKNGWAIKMYHDGKWSGIHAIGDDLKQLRDNLVESVQVGIHFIAKSRRSGFDMKSSALNAEYLKKKPKELESDHLRFYKLIINGNNIN